MQCTIHKDDVRLKMTWLGCLKFAVHKLRTIDYSTPFWSLTADIISSMLLLPTQKSVARFSVSVVRRWPCDLTTSPVSWSSWIPISLPCEDPGNGKMGQKRLRLLG